MLSSIRRRLSSSSKARLSGPELIDARKAALETLSRKVKIEDVALTGKGVLDMVVIELLMEGDLLRFFDEHGAPISKSELKKNMPMRRIKSEVEARISFQFEPETPTTLGKKVRDVFCAVGAERFTICIRTKEDADASVSAGVTLLSTAMGEGSVQQKREGNEMWKTTIEMPSNVLPIPKPRENYDPIFAELHGLAPAIALAHESYEVFKYGGLEGKLDSRQEQYSIEISIKSDLLGELSGGADGVKANLKGNRTRFMELVIDISVLYFSDKHEGLLKAREAIEVKRKKNSEAVEKTLRDAKDAADKAAHELKKLEEAKIFQQSEEKAKGKMIVAMATFQSEMNRIIQSLPLPAGSWLPFWSPGVDKHIYVAGFRAAGKSSICLGCEMVVTDEWDNLEKYASAVRVPFGHAEGSLEKATIDLKFKTDKTIDTKLEDIKGHQSKIAGFQEGVPNVLLALVVPVNKLVVSNGNELVVSDQIDQTIRSLPSYRSACAIILTNWDELFYESTTEEQILENVDRFWREHYGIVEKVNEMVETHLKSSKLNEKVPFATTLIVRSRRAIRCLWVTRICCFTS